MEKLHLQQHSHKLRVQEAAWLGKHTPKTPPTGILQTTTLAPHAHAHLGRSHLHPELGEELAQPRVGPVVVDDETAVHRMLAAVGGGHVVGVCVTAEAVVRLEQRDVVGAAQQVGSGEPRDP